MGTEELKKVSSFLALAFLHSDRLSIFAFKIYRCQWGGNIKGNSKIFGYNGKLECTDFVRRITVPRYTVKTRVANLRINSKKILGAF